MLKRKIENLLHLWKGSGKALLVDGAPQVGKTHILRKFTEENFASTLYINFLENRNAARLLSKATDTKDFLIRLSALSDTPLVKGETAVFLDEIQELSKVYDIMTQSKFLVEEGSYRYIFSGSMLKLELENVKSWPVGYLVSETMFPLDFEEFLWACGVSPELLKRDRSCFEERISVEDYMHDRLSRMLGYYLLVGGMPEAVKTFVETADLNHVTLSHRKVQGMNRKDIARYAKGNKKLRIRQTYNLVPDELSRASRRFQLKDLKEVSRGEDISSSFSWMDDAGIAIPVYSASFDFKPHLVRNSDRTSLKLFYEDVGLLTNEYMTPGLRMAVLEGRLDICGGAICENFVCQELRAHGFDRLYYFSRKSHGEADFLVNYEGKVLPMNVKSGGNFRAHASLDRLMTIPNYAIDKAFVFCPGNVEVDGDITYFPLYMAGFLQGEDRYFIKLLGAETHFS